MKRGSMNEIATIPFDVVRQAQSGDVAQIGVLYEHYHLDVFRYLYYLLGDRHTAEDLTSDVFLRMIRSLPHYRLQGSPFRAWLYQIARHLAVDHFRRVKGRQPAQVHEGLPADGPDPAVMAQRGLDSERLQRALARLGDEQREVIVLRFVVGLPISETAAALEKSEDAVKGLQRRALYALRELLSDWEVDHV